MPCDPLVSCCLGDEPICNNTVETYVEPVIVEENITVESKPTGEFPERNFTYKELFSYINNITDSDFKFKADNRNLSYIQELKNKDHHIFVSNKDYPLWVIEVINDSDDQIKNSTMFLEYTRLPGWDGYEYFLNDTWWYRTMPPMTEKELEEKMPGYDWKDYRIHDSEWIRRIWIQKALNTSLGVIPDTQYQGRVFDQDGYWVSNFDSSMALQVIPCTKDIIIYQNFESTVTTQTYNLAGANEDALLNNWETLIDYQRKTMTNQTELVMEFCGITKEMLEGSRVRDIMYNDTLVYNWKLFYKLRYNFSFFINNVSLDKPRDGYNWMKSVNVTFINLEQNYLNEVNYWSSYVSVKVLINDSGKIEEYFDGFIKGEALDPGESVTKYFEKESSRFKDNATLIFYPYFGYPDLAEPKRSYLGDPVVYELFGQEKSTSPNSSLTLSSNATIG